MNILLFFLLIILGSAVANYHRDAERRESADGYGWYRRSLKEYVSEKHKQFYKTASYLLHGYETLLEGGYGADKIAPLTGLRSQLFRHIIDINATELTIQKTHDNITALLTSITGRSVPELDAPISKRKIFVKYHNWLYEDMLQTVYDMKKENLYIVSQGIDRTFHIQKLVPHFLRINAIVEDLILNQLINPKLRNQNDIWTGGALAIEYADWYPEYEQNVDKMLLKVENRLKLHYDLYDKNGRGTYLDLAAYYKHYNVPQPVAKMTPVADLETKRKLYVLKQTLPRLPPMADDAVNPEKYDQVDQLGIALLFSRAFLRSLWNGFNLQIKTGLFLAPPAWRTLADLEEEFHRNSVLYYPYGYFRMDDDQFFGLQRLAGANANLVKLATSIPEKFGVTDEMVRPFLEGRSLEDAVRSKRIFIVDFEFIKDTKAKTGFWFSAPMALFYVDGRDKLIPIAIQLQQDKGPNNPVFLPSDNQWTWRLAKMWFNNVDAVYHEMVTHLGLTHLVMDGVNVVTHRQLPESHPLFKLLLPHYRFMIPNNKAGKRTLLLVGGALDVHSNIGILNALEMFRKRLTTWTLHEDGDLLEDLKSRQVHSTRRDFLGQPEGLPDYPYRDDGVLVWRAIKDYVTEYVDFYYATNNNVTEDAFLENWYEELTRSWSKGGVGMKVLPGNPSGYTTKGQLIGTLTSVIFICSAQHAAANFLQWDEYGHPPFYPLQLRGTPPMDKSPRSEQNILDALPERRTYIGALRTARFLSNFATNPLGDFPENRIDSKAQYILDRFRSELRKVSDIVKLRNLQREPPYPFLDPENIPNALST